MLSHCNATSPTSAHSLCPVVPRPSQRAATPWPALLSLHRDSQGDSHDFSSSHHPGIGAQQHLNQHAVAASSHQALRGHQVPHQHLSPWTDACMEDPRPQEGPAKAAPFTVQNINPSAFCTHRYLGSCRRDPHSVGEPSTPTSQLYNLDVQRSYSAKQP